MVGGDGCSNDCVVKNGWDCNFATPNNCNLFAEQCPEKVCPVCPDYSKRSAPGLLALFTAFF